MLYQMFLATAKQHDDRVAIETLDSTDKCGSGH